MFKSEELSELHSYYDAFLTADSKDATDASFAAYNDVYDSIGDKYSEEFMSQRFVSMLEVNYLPFGIDQIVANEKKMFLEQYDASYNRIGVQMYAEGVMPTFTLIKKAEFTAPISEIVVVVADGTVHNFDLSAYYKDST